MTLVETQSAIKDVPVGSVLQIIKKNGAIMEAILMSKTIEGTERKEYGNLVVPALPPALILRGGMRFGNFRLDLNDIVNIARVESLH